MILAGALLALVQQAAEPVRLGYRIELVTEAEEGSTPGVRITVSYATPAWAARTDFRVGERSGGSVGGLDLEFLGAGMIAPDHDMGPAKHERIATHEWAVLHPPEAGLFLTYLLPWNDLRRSEDAAVYVRPMVESDRLHAIGDLALLRPSRLSPWDPVEVTLEWSGFDEAGWKTVSSFGEGDQSVRVKLVELTGAVLRAGRDLRLHEREVEGNRLVVALEGDAWPFEDKEFADLSRSIVAEQRAFFDDHSQPWYLVSLVPVGVPGSTRTTRSGMGLTDAFAVFLRDGLGLDHEGRPGETVAHTLAHEMFHNWNGLLIVRANPTGLGTWFSEGFTDFYARRLLYRAGRIDLATYARIVNGTIAEHALSPARDAPNARLAELQWEDEAYHRMAYVRGDLAGALIDRAIREHSKGERSLDDLMRDLATAARETGERVSTEDLLARVEALTDAEFTARLRAIVVDGAPLELPLDLFAPCLVGELGETWTTDPGFDTEAIRETGLVAGVREGSPAHEAGLRDGQRCTSYVFSEGPGPPTVTVRVLVDAEERELTFPARGEAVPVPVFRPAEGATGPCSAL